MRVLIVMVSSVADAVFEKFPERWFPRRFDLFGASHQLMHTFVVLAALTYTCAVISAFDHRYEKGAVC